MLNPQRVLERGFAIVSDTRGHVVRDASALAAGELLDIRFSQGKARVVVEKKRI